MKKEEIHNLIVPINLQALCIGSLDVDENKFIKSTADFSLLPYEDAPRMRANISEHILSHPFASDKTSLPKGVHLHWSLPDALTKGGTNEKGELSFPTVPNRWLVTRIKDNSSSAKSWIIESDYLSKVQLDKVTPTVTVPYDYGNAPENQPYRYMGRAIPCSEFSSVEKGKEYYEKLTTIGYGELTFASSYANCSSVFGFHDDLADLEGEINNISYVVTGWYDDPNDDFLKTSDIELLEFFQANNWSFQDDAENNINKDQSGSLYSGLIKNIYWEPGKSYLKQPESGTDIVFAPTNIEALSALFAKYASLDKPHSKQKIEELMNILQLGLLKNIQQPGIFFKLSQDLNNKRFQHRGGGKTYTLVPNKDSEADNGNQAGDPSRLPSKNYDCLSDGVSKKLNELNIAQQQFDQLANAIMTLRQQIFMDWYKYMVQKYDTDTETSDVEFGDIEIFVKKEINTLLEKLETKFDASEKKVADLKGELESVPGFTLQNIGGSRYYFPADPVVLLANSEGRWNYAGERNKTSDGTLLCRTSDQIINCKNSETLKTFMVPNVPFKQDLTNLIQEAVFLSGDGEKGSGVIPEKIAVQDWGDEDPWLPLTMQWQVQYEHLKKTEEYGQYSQNHIMDNFKFDQSDELVYKAQAPELDAKEIEPYNGHIILTPGARSNLAEKIKQEVKHNPDPELEKLLAEIKNISVLSQSLNGFQESLLMQKKSLQMEVYDPLEKPNPFTGDCFSNDSVKGAVANQNITAPQPQVAFNPIQDGVSHIEKLRVVDTFGRYLDLDVSDVTYPSTMPTYNPESGESSWLKGYTRLNQPARLSFRFLSAEHDNMEMNSHPSSNPVCGWVMHNKLDYSLMFYAKDGEAIGSLRPTTTTSGETIAWQSAPGVYPYGTSMESCFEGKNSQLRSLANSILANGLDYLKSFLDTIDKTTCYTAPQSYAQSIDYAVLIGKPLALVQTSLCLELQGLPSANTSWESLKKDIGRDEDSLERDNNAFTEVQFPVKLGDHANFEDGVVGYFTDNGEGVDYTTFNAAIPDPSDNEHIVSGNNVLLQPNSSVLNESLGKAKKEMQQTISFLVDPRASIHAITGILPVKSIAIPENQYVSALKSIYVTFNSAPVLNDMKNGERIDIPLGLESGKKWTWLEIAKEKGSKENGQEDTKWKEKETVKNSQQKIFKNPQQIYEGWLKLSKEK